MQGFPMDSHVTWTKDPDTGAVMPKFDRAVTSEPLREYIKGVITNGVLPNPSNNLQVSAGTNGMTVLVNAGFCVIEGGLAIEPNTRTLEVTSADSTYDRIDTVVARWDSNDAVRRVDLHIKAGIPASTPVRPTLTRNESIYELGLADVFVTKGVATITNEKITDTRMESARCGICSSISEWDTTTIYQQIQSDLAGFKSNEQAEFMTWFNKMKDQLTEDAAGKLQTEVDDVRGQICSNLLKPTAKTRTINGVTFTNNGDGTYTVNGTASGWTAFPLMTFNDFAFLENKKLIGCPAGGSDSTYTLYMSCNSGKEYYDYGNGVIISNIPSEATSVELLILVRAGQTVNNLTFKPMLTKDLNATYDDFVPYTGDSGRLNEDVANLVDSVKGKIHTNLLHLTAPTQTVNGVTFTNNGNGTYTVNGTASGWTAFPLMTFNDFAFLENKKLIGCPAGGSGSTYTLYMSCNSGKEYYDYGNGVIISNIPSEATSVELLILVRAGQTVNNLTFKPMITTDPNATYDDFVPYTGDSGRLNEDVANLIKDMSAVLEKVYPVGSIYMSVVNTSPAALFGGTWEQIQGRFLLGADSRYTAGSTGGEAQHTLTVDEMPRHSHDYYFDADSSKDWGIGLNGGGVEPDKSANASGPSGRSWTLKIRETGGSQPHNNMPPYLAVYMWKRTA